ncbi:hypothetical protein O3P69_007355 [Scylla paramamosain]|uniref:Uncharacterized protein n=1 Tax=Scylla paramamosain TaxID=85552 RepID=A0AAW0V3X3_SCYPA
MQSTSLKKNEHSLKDDTPTQHTLTPPTTMMAARPLINLSCCQASVTEYDPHAYEITRPSLSTSPPRTPSHSSNNHGCHAPQYVHPTLTLTISAASATHTVKPHLATPCQDVYALGSGFGFGLCGSRDKSVLGLLSLAGY